METGRDERGRTHGDRRRQEWRLTWRQTEIREVEYFATDRVKREGMYGECVCV
jgi:hypothetical protein